MCECQQGRGSCTGCGLIGRWERLLQNNDDLNIWKAINWKGEYEGKSSSSIRPLDDEFKRFFERTFNLPDYLGLLNQYENYEVPTPVLDDTITAAEVQQQIKQLKVDKACGPDGLTSGIF